MKAKINKKAKKIVLKEGKFIRFLKKGEWEYVERNNCTDIVIILSMTKDKRVVFVEQYRPPVGKNVIEFPAGLVNDRNLKKKESLFSAAKRELLEETGYKAKRITKVISGPASSGSSSDILSVVMAHDIEKIDDGGGDELESIVVHTVPIKEVDRWLKSQERKGKLVGPRIYAGLYFFKKYNRLS
ncbi:MAG: NUDIX hydrolase [Candidatus Zapsychrus exili]|nr:NUDIX hydrolase [Candidatus Zapsychrus exili]